MRVTSSVIEPPWFSVPSTLYTLIGSGSTRVFMPFLCTNARSINSPVAPLSSNAFSDIVLCVSSVVIATSSRISRSRRADRTKCFSPFSGLAFVSIVSDLIGTGTGIKHASGAPSSVV